MRAVLSKLLRYGVTGGIAAIVDAGGFALLLKAGLAGWAAGTLSSCIAALVNYGLSSRFVFARSATPQGFALFFVTALIGDRKSTRLNSSHVSISYAVFC